jgi:hypothetical protein
MEKNDGVGCSIRHTSGMVLHESSSAGLIMEPDLEEYDLQSFPHPHKKGQNSWHGMCYEKF